MNDVGEKIPNWVESARLYYAYTGDASVVDIVKKLVDYALDHGISPASFAWPNFPYTTTNAGDLEFRGFTSAGRFVLHETQVDHAGDMGLAFYRMYLLTGETRYLQAAIKIADVLASHARVGTAEHAVWPYRVLMDSGKITAEYGANWIGCYLLLENLAHAGHGNVAAYREASAKAREFLLRFPMNTGYWTDGHTDNPVNSHTYKSNMSASNAVLHLLDDPEFDPQWKSHVPMLIRWTEDNFVFRTAPGEPATQWGANLVGEQDDFNHKMDYQTARYGAACARWYAASGDAAYKEKVYRSLKLGDVLQQRPGPGVREPGQHGISNWWSEAYGEGPACSIPPLPECRSGRRLEGSPALFTRGHQGRRVFGAKTGIRGHRPSGSRVPASVIPTEEDRCRRNAPVRAGSVGRGGLYAEGSRQGRLCRCDPARARGQGRRAIRFGRDLATCVPAPPRRSAVHRSRLAVPRVRGSRCVGRYMPHAPPSAVFSSRLSM